MMAKHSKSFGWLAAVAAIYPCWFVLGCGGGVPKEFRPQGQITAFSNDEWQKVLSSTVTPDGFVWYDALKRNENGAKDALLRYVGLINAVAPHNRPELFPTAADKRAYYINAFNALCMYGVLQKSLPTNVRDSGMYTFSFFPVGGENVNLDTLEKKWVRTPGDPREYFALNRMTKSSPPLRKEPYEGSRLDEQFADQARKFLSDSRGAIRTGEQVTLSSIFKFHESEFIEFHRKQSGSAEVGLLESIQPFADRGSPVLGAAGYTFMNYDWTINRPY
jgi:hypothetical protein